MSRVGKESLEASQDALGPTFAVSPCSGAVVTLECVEKLIRKDMVDPVNGDTLTERDIIVLQRGGTGFAGSGVKLQVEMSRPVMQA